MARNEDGGRFTADNSGDPTRALRLLWRDRVGEPRGSRGPRTKFTVDDVVIAAAALADDEGLESFSMRRVAERLGIGVMTLYTYVPDRATLLGLVRDWIAAEGSRPPHRGRVRERLRVVAVELWDEYSRHPWLVDLQVGRPWLGPNESDRYEWQLAALEGSGLDDLDIDQTITALSAYVAGVARWKVVADRSRALSGVDDEAWWQVNAPILTEVMDGDRYPVSSRVGQAAGEAYGLGDPERSFEFGLERFLDGIDALIARSAPPEG